MNDRLAILGGEPAVKIAYPEWPVHDEREVEAVAEVVRSGHWGGYPYPGPRTTAFCRSSSNFRAASTRSWPPTAR